MRARLAFLALSLAAALLGAGCGGAGGAGDDDPRRLTVYSGRAEELVGPLYQRFERATGIQVDARYGDSAELAATLAEEGGNSPAEVFFAQDAGALGAVAAAGSLKTLDPELLERVDRRFRDPEGRWVGVSGRARVVAYDTRKLKPAQLPGTIFAFIDPRWRERIGLAPTNASFQAFVSAMRISVGDARTLAWLKGIEANEPVLLENNIQTLEAIAGGEVDVGFVNHYYLYELRAERPDLPVENHFTRPGDPGSLVNVSGVGLLSDSPEARRFAQFLLDVEGQRFFATDTEEYPLIDGVRSDEKLRPLEQIQGPDVTLGQLGAKLPSTVELIREAGLTP
ncbi:MAG: Ferric iron ABC transporter, iron-binding protein [uncultured Solirubrobacteraceae bacterium]|uniref:Ferric iron ABC transporter, iron-binding protein n=1 Tax=uncultured Solirubrobacteraceae bacterium TaxID=1162706 RepID=A0A6J4U1C4_9ACTN|nr:MAG: Ferric iron ABC transporter, iron-binding protein [uncultured Solirubrobacteraceae bacterium]